MSRTGGTILTKVKRILLWMKQERSGSKLGGLGEGCEEPELQTEELGPDSLGCGKQWKI